MLARSKVSKILQWINQSRRKPLLLGGARQVGKTCLIAELVGKSHFREVHRLDFRLDPTLSGIFSDSLDPYRLVELIELRLNARIDLQRDMIFLDEIGDCPRAVSSLKYFAEDLPFAYVCATGSNLGLLDSFPVGSVHYQELFPLCFEEFLQASGNLKLLESFLQRRPDKAVFQQLWRMLLDYYFVGGLPEAVAHWFDAQAKLAERVSEVTQIHRDLLFGYRQDFGKQAGKLNALHIDAVFSSVPRQLAAYQDNSAQRFKYKGVIDKQQRHQQLQGPVDWLVKSKLVHQCYPISGRPAAPLQSKIRANIFKLYLFDIGLLGHMLNISYRTQVDQNYDYKGYFAENFVQQELTARSGRPTYSWQMARAEIEFIHQSQDDAFIPVEVKSSVRTRARSLRSYLERYNPSRAIILAGKQHDFTRRPVEIWPLYEAQFICGI